MFWKFNLISTSHVETILNKENVTLKELMDEEDILQECKSQTKKLIDFLVLPDIMDELVTLITQEPSEEIEEKTRYKYPNVACELLTSEVGAINDALATNEALLNKLYSFIDTEKPLNPLLASFFSKTMSLLVNKKTEQTFEFLKSKDDFLSLILNHIETSAIMDLLLRMVTCTENNDTHSAIVKWLNEQQLIKRLISLIDPIHSEDQNGNAAHTLSDIVKISRDYMSLQQDKAESDPLLNAIESSALISELLEHMLANEKRESVLVSGILVILSLLEFKRQGPAGQYQPSQIQQQVQQQQQQQQSIQAENTPHSFASALFRNDGPELMTELDAERLNTGVEGVLSAVTPRLIDFTKLLVEPPLKATFSSSASILEQQQPPLGWSRLEIARLLSALLNTNNHLVNTQLNNLGTLNILLDLFFKYTWNNFLHTQVEQIMGTILHNNPTCDQEDNKVHPLLDQLFSEGKIIERILDAWQENEQEQCKPGKHRKGYMGHLIKMANHICQCLENGVNGELIKLKLKELSEDDQERWEKFVTDTLTDINKKQTSPLVIAPITHNSLDDDCVDFRDLPYTQETALQQAFSDYQMQQMTNNFVDQFGFNDEEFLESDDSITGQLDRLAKVNFQFVPENNVRTSELFEQTCRDRNNPLGDVDSDEDVWEDKEQEITFASGLASERSRLTTHNNSGGDNSSSSSGDSDEEIDKPPLGMTSSSPIATPQGGAGEEVKMDIDPWNAAFPITQPPDTGSTVAMDTTNPWDIGSGGNSGDQSWADFSSFSPFNCKEFSVPSPVSSSLLSSSSSSMPCPVVIPMESATTLHPKENSIPDPSLEKSTLFKSELLIGSSSETPLLNIGQDDCRLVSPTLQQDIKENSMPVNVPFPIDANEMHTLVVSIPPPPSSPSHLPLVVESDPLAKQQLESPSELKKEIVSPLEEEKEGPLPDSASVGFLPVPVGQQASQIQNGPI